MSEKGVLVSTSSKSQADSILAQFPGPVVLYFSRGRILLMLACVSILFWGALALRAVLILVFPSAASLKLDAGEFEIGHVFRSIRLPWRDVSEFRVETRYRFPFKIGGPVDQVLYEGPDKSDRQSEPKPPRVLPDLYGQPRIPREELVRLLNEWRRRALALPDAPRRAVPLVSGAGR